MNYLGLHNKPKAKVHPGHMWTGPKEEEEEEVGNKYRQWITASHSHNVIVSPHL